MYDFRARRDSHYTVLVKEIEDIDRIISYLTDIKTCLIALEDINTAQVEKQKRGVMLLMHEAVESIKKLTGEEFKFFLSLKEAQAFKSLIDDMKRAFDAKFFSALYKGLPEFAGAFGKAWIKQLKERITIIENQQEKMRALLEDAGFREIMEEKARKLAQARPQLSTYQKGCYHGFPPEKLLSVMGTGIASNTFRKYALNLMIQSPQLQGERYISVFDTYSYYRLSLYFQEQGLEEEIKTKEKITSEQMINALKANPDLNLAKNIQKNAELIARQWPSFIRNSFFQSEKKRVATYHHPISVLIDDTMYFFPITDDYSGEGLMVDRIPQKKIIGFIYSNVNATFKETFDKLFPYLRIMGLPIYDAMNGNVIWPI